MAEECGGQLISPRPSLPGWLAAAGGWPLGPPRLLCHPDDLLGDFPPECKGARAPLSALTSHCAVPCAQPLRDRAGKGSEDDWGLHASSELHPRKPCYCDAVDRSLHAAGCKHREGGRHSAELARPLRASCESGLDLGHLLNLEARQLPTRISRPSLRPASLPPGPFQSQVGKLSCGVFSCWAVFKPHTFQQYRLG